ncbi:MAG: hypothetical protein HOV80_32490 [Polyangiaceae bacterium]|nr:hypothetical protein [Polyangiaceae bacterium]
MPPRLLIALCSVAALSVAGAAVAKETDDEKERPQSDASTSASPAAARPSQEGSFDEPFDGSVPSPLEVDYAQYGVALATEIPIEPGGICPSDATVPCIIGLGGGPVLRGGYRPAVPWYIGGAYQFSKLDSNNLYRLGILQQLRAEMRYVVSTGTRAWPYATWGLGGMVYGNEFSVQTGGATALAGLGLELEITRFAVVGLNASYQPMLFAEFVDSAGQARDTGVAHYVHMELLIELKSELTRE